MKIAFIGLGTMGIPMATRVAEATDVELSFYDLRPEQLQKVASYGHVAGSVAEAVESADAVFTVLPADQHVDAVSSAFAEVAKPGQVYVDFSTIGPSTIEAAATKLEARGVETVSAGMTKSIEGAKTGTLTLFVGGPPALPAVLEPAFGAMAADVRLVGSLGAAKALKLMNNMVVSCLDVAICEALALGSKLGLSYDEIVESLQREGADNWPLQNHIVKHVLPDDLGPGFFSTLFLIKDVNLCLKLAERQNVPVIFPAIAVSSYRGTVAVGHGDDYHMVVVRWLEHAANLSGDPLTEEVDLPTAATEIARGVAALQAMITFEALEILDTLGVAPLAAAAHFEAGSAGNDSLRGMAAHAQETAAGPTPRQLSNDLAAVIALAARARVPATMFEVGRQVAIGHAAVYGEDAGFWSVMAQVGSTRSEAVGLEQRV